MTRLWNLLDVRMQTFVLGSMETIKSIYIDRKSKRSMLKSRIFGNWVIGFIQMNILGVE